MKESNTGIVPQEHWDQGYENYIFKRNSNKDDIYEFIRKYVPQANSSKSVLEIGSFPGTYTSEFGELGYTINGIDIQSGNASELPVWLKKQGYKVDQFIDGDIFKFECTEKFNIVCSFGFIEHFKNYLEVIDIHCGLVEKGGMILITTPNYKGYIQRVMHSYLTPNDYDLHYIPSMNPRQWAKHLEMCGFEIIFNGYFGGMNFWIGKEGLKGVKKIIYEISMRILPRLGRLIPFESMLFSKNCGIVARKKS